jgi:hypothetical protein
MIDQNQPSVNVTLTGTSTAGSGFYDPGPAFTGRLQVSVGGGVTVNSFSYVNPTTITMNLSTVGASLGAQDVTVTNPDGQVLTGTGLLTVTTGAGAPTCAVTPSGTATNVSPIVFTMTFSEPVSGLTPAGITVTGGTAGTFTSVNASTYTLSVTPSGQGPVTCQVNAAAARAVSDNQTSLASNQASVTYDTVPPAPPVITSPPNPTLTNNNRPTLAGTAEAASTVTVSDGATVLGTTLATGSGTFSFVPSSPLADGPHGLSATARDLAGNVSAPSATVSLTIDTVAPTCVVSASSPTRLSPITFTLTFSQSVVGLSAAGITSTNGTLGALAGTGAVYTIPVTPGANGTVTCQVVAGAAQDLAGNPNAASNVDSVLFDTTPPAAPGTPSGTPNPNHTGTYTLSWTAASDGTGSGVATYTLWRSLDGGALAQVAAGVIGTSFAENGLPQGAYRYEVQAVDAAGNIGPLSPLSPAVVVNTTGPHTTITLSPPNPSSSAGATFLFASSEAGSTFQTLLDGAAAWTSNGTSTAITYSGLANGAHTFQVRAVDSAGNIDPTPPSYTWTVNTSGGVIQTPRTLITGEPPDPTAQTTATFTFVSSEAGGTFQVQLDLGGWVSNGASGTITYPGLARGTHTFMVRAIDAALNVDPAPATYTWTIVAPPLDGTAPCLNPFGSDVAVTHWVLAGTDPLVGWAVDGTPASMPGNAYHSAPYSLNYNNGTDYDTPGVSNSGTATSPSIGIAGLPGARLKFFCNYRTETPGTDHDFRWVRISNSGFASLLVNEQLSTSPGSVLAGSCAAMGTWHEHVIPLTGMAGPIQVQFFFDTGDAALNHFPGWFVDDLEISDLFVSGLNQYDPGSAVPIPVGGTAASNMALVGGVLSLDASGNVRLEVEIQPVGTPFTGVPTASATASGPGSPVSVPLSGLATGSFHWQARTVSGGVTSAWMSFGLNAESDPDFIVAVLAAVAAAGSGGGGGHHGCGLSGWEPFVILGILSAGRRFVRRKPSFPDPRSKQ